MNYLCCDVAGWEQRNVWDYLFSMVIRTYRPIGGAVHCHDGIR